MNALFAPWRMEFVEKKNPDSECVFCRIGRSKEKNPERIVHRGNCSYVVMNKFPYSNGHLLVIPYRHENDWRKLTKEELFELTELTQHSLRALGEALQPEGFNLGVNLGRAAGAGIEAHVHQHVVPRWMGDFNFMPLLSETRMISEHLQVTYEKILKAWPA